MVGLGSLFAHQDLDLGSRRIPRGVSAASVLALPALVRLGRIGLGRLAGHGPGRADRCSAVRWLALGLSAWFASG
jgi:hypothetical protein